MPSYGLTQQARMANAALVNTFVQQSTDQILPRISRGAIARAIAEPF